MLDVSTRSCPPPVLVIGPWRPSRNPVGEAVRAKLERASGLGVHRRAPGRDSFRIAPGPLPRAIGCRRERIIERQRLFDRHRRAGEGVGVVDL